MPTPPPAADPTAGPAPAPTPTVIRFTPRGGALALFRCRAPEVLLAGPAGTGKSRACLEKLHALAWRYPGCRILATRKTLASLTGTGIVTYREKVLHPAEGVAFFGGNKAEPAAFRYPNGSRLVVGGLDRATKIMSTEFDFAYVQEATELTENDWEMIVTRLRNGVAPYQQLIADCNPEGPQHWLRRRAAAGRLLIIESRHEDNPLYWDAAQARPTPAGASYFARLDSLTGVRYRRLRLGQWAAAEGVVYDAWDRAVHLVDRFPIPPDWPRYIAVDFGYRNPFVAQWWAEDPDGRLYRYREIYRTGRLVEDHARDMLALMGVRWRTTPAGERVQDWTTAEPRPVAVICDHDREDRATLERHLGLPTVPAYKDVATGIQAVQARLRVEPDGRPRLLLLRDSLVEVDPDLRDAKRPLCTEEEVEGYVWDERAGRRRGEEPLKQDDHGLDALRYAVAYRDLADRAGRFLDDGDAGDRADRADRDDRFPHVF
jgi:hypothetical protein